MKRQSNKPNNSFKAWLKPKSWFVFYLIFLFKATQYRIMFKPISLSNVYYTIVYALKHFVPIWKLQNKITSIRILKAQASCIILLFCIIQCCFFNHWSSGIIHWLDIFVMCTLTTLEYLPQCSQRIGREREVHLVHTVSWITLQHLGEI